MTTIELNDRELATVLAGLRMLQKHFLNDSFGRVVDTVREHFTDEIRPLPPSGIDILCAKINMPHLLRKPR